MYHGPKRKYQRLQNYDYSENGYYFVTICTKGRECFFGEIDDGNMVMNDYGQIAYNNFQEINKHFSNCYVDKFVVMPNHVHGIIIINNDSATVGDADLRPLQRGSSGKMPDWQKNTKMLLSKCIHGFKSSTTRTIRQDYGDYEFSWQRSFHDTIIKNEKQLQNTRQYIIDNPRKWQEDENNLENIEKK